ncbi:hypothetical protein TWF281_008591 [Arthrobotrys megalospora]
MALSTMSRFSDLHTLSSIKDDMITALALQLEDLDTESGLDGDRDPPINLDRELALATYRCDIQNLVDSHRAIHDIESEEHQMHGSGVNPAQDTASCGPGQENLTSLISQRDAQGTERENGRRQGERTICVVCQKLSHQSDRTEDTMEVLACGHVYCNECIHHLAATAAKSEISYPARCCAQIVDNNFLLRVLTSEAYGQYLNAGIEFSSLRRLYCANTNCLKFIPDDVTGVGRSVRCRACNSHTCQECRELQHDGRCVQTEGTRQLQRLVRQNGWRNCSKCGRAIELTEGCDHMTCVCGHQFCYSCGVDYEDCVCKVSFDNHWSEDDTEGWTRDPNSGWAGPTHDSGRRYRNDASWLGASHRTSGWPDPIPVPRWFRDDNEYDGRWRPRTADDDSWNREYRRQNREHHRQNREYRGSDTGSSSYSEFESIGEPNATRPNAWNGDGTHRPYDIPCGTYLLGPDGLIERRANGDYISRPLRSPRLYTRGLRSSRRRPPTEWGDDDNDDDWSSLENHIPRSPRYTVEGASNGGIFGPDGTIPSLENGHGIRSHAGTWGAENNTGNGNSGADPNNDWGLSATPGGNGGAGGWDDSGNVGNTGGGGGNNGWDNGGGAGSGGGGGWDNNGGGGGGGGGGNGGWGNEGNDEDKKKDDKKKDEKKKEEKKEEGGWGQEDDSANKPDSAQETPANPPPPPDVPRSRSSHHSSAQNRDSNRNNNHQRQSRDNNQQSDIRITRASRHSSSQSQNSRHSLIKAATTWLQDPVAIATQTATATRAVTTIHVVTTTIITTIATIATIVATNIATVTIIAEVTTNVMAAVRAVKIVGTSSSVFAMSTGINAST